MPLNLKLKLAILASGQPQRQVAATCGIRENRFPEIVRGWTEPREDERQAIAAALGKSPAELFNKQDEGHHRRGAGARPISPRGSGARERQQRVRGVTHDA